MEKFGINNIKKCLAVIIEAGNVIDTISNEKGGMSAKLTHGMLLFDELMAVAGVDFKLLDDEYKDLSQDEKNDIVIFLKAKFDIADDLLESKIEEAFALLLKVEDLVKEIVAFSKSL